MNYQKSTRLALAVFVFFAAARVLNAQVLSVTNRLQLWLKADAGITTNASGGVTQWADQSTHGNNAVQITDAAAPLFVANAQNNKPALRFDGVDDFLDVADADSISIAGDISSFFVVKFDDFATYRAVWGKTVDNLPAPTDYYTLPGTGIPRLYRGDGQGTGASDIGAADGAARFRAGTYLVAGFEMAGTTATHYLNGQTTGGGEITATLLDGDQPLKVGTRNDFFTKMKGEIAELLIYDVALSDTDRDSVINYLKVKYNIINLPPTITLSSAPPETNINPGALLTLTATATDPDGSVARVDFFANGQLIGTATATPHSMKVTVETPGDVTFTAVATDDKDATAVSQPITVTAASTSPPPLTVTNRLQLWLEAGGGVTTNAGGGVMLWADQSGHGNNAAPFDDAGAPLWVDNAANGKPVLRFDGAGDYLEVPSTPSVAITGDIASFFVVKFDDFAAFRGVWAKTDLNFPAPTDYYTLPGSGIPRAFRGDSTLNSLASVDGAGRLATNTYLVLGFNQAGLVFTHYLNGAPFGSGQMNVTPADVGKPLRIGTRDDFATQMKGDIAELLIYDTALNSADLKSLAAYLGGKYGVPIVTPTNSPPTVTINDPTNGATFAAPANVTVAVTAADSDGSVVQVDLYLSGGLVATHTSAPFSATLGFPAAGNFTLTAVATDNLGGVSTSPPVSITVTSTQPFPLPSAARLKLWLRADAGVATNLTGAVTKWTDQSGKFNDAVQTNDSSAPLWIANAVNGKPALRFDGDNDYLSISNSPSIAIIGDLSSFFVVQFDDFATYRAVWAKTEGNLPRSTDYYILPDTGIPRLIRGGTGGLGSVDGATALPSAQHLIAGFEMEGSTARLYFNGQEDSNGQITAMPTDAGTPLLIGTRGDLFTKMKGDIAEIIIYDIALSGADRNAVLTYLASKYAIDIGAVAPSFTVSRSGNDITISWPASAGGFLFESSDVLPAANWANVSFNPPPPGQNPSVTVTPAAGNKFYRLRKP